MIVYVFDLCVLGIMQLDVVDMVERPIGVCTRAWWCSVKQSVVLPMKCCVVMIDDVVWMSMLSGCRE